MRSKQPKASAIQAIKFDCPIQDIGPAPGKKKRGRKPHVRTPETEHQVHMLAMIGTPLDDIARIIRCHNLTLRARYKDIIANARAIADGKVAIALYRQAAGAPAEYDAKGKLLRAEIPPVPMISKFWAETRMGWKPPVLQGEDDHVVEVRVRGGLPAGHRDRTPLPDETQAK